MSKLNVLVTGATGFVGQALVNALRTQGYRVIPGVRAPCVELPGALVLGDIEKPLELSCDVPIDVVVHCAARAHQMKENNENPTLAYQQANVDGLKHVFEATQALGVKRFIFLSTIKVLGEHTTTKPFDEHSPANPLDPYAQSKWEAECWLRKHAGDIEYVIIRPPLIVGPEAKGNIKRLLTWLSKGLPLPLKSIKNKRSMISLSGLCSFIVQTIEHPMAANEIFCVAEETMSTPEWVKRMAAKAQLRATFMYCPVWLLKLGAVLVNRRDFVSKLVDSLEVDARKSKRLRQQASEPKAF